MAKKAKKSKASKVERELIATVEKLRARLAKSEAKAEKWKSEAKDSRKAALSLEKKLLRQTERADRAKQKAKSAKKAKEVLEASTEQSAEDLADQRAAATATQPEAAAPPTEQVPDETWSVTRLRAEARKQGLAGYSRKTKAQLLATLR